MAMQVITRDMLPSAIRTSVPRVTLGEQGQIVLSKALADKLGAVVATRVAFDSDSRKLTLAFATAIPAGKEKEYFTVRKAKKTNQLMLSGGGILKHCGYDYKAAGSQSYEQITLNKLQVSLVLPAETPARKPSTPRPRKAKAPAEVVAAAPVAKAAAAANAEDGDLAELEGAE